MKRILSLFILATILLTACGQTNAPRPLFRDTTTPQSTPSVVPATFTPTATFTPIPSPTFTPTATPEIGGINYVGYWLKMTKDFNEYGSQTMTMYYQNGSELTVIATFCVRGSDSGTPNGFYFIALDRPTTYPTARGYETTFFSHNFGWKLGNRSWYLHPAPWNDSGEAGCPLKSTGGCVNMRPDDFDIILSGGDYTNPLTGEKAVIPNLGIGTPFVITYHESDCKYVGECFNYFGCTTGRECFAKYTCQLCGDPSPRYMNMLRQAPFIEIFDLPR